MKRTIKRISLKLNKGKWEILLEIARAYAKQKDYFFLSYAPPASFALYKRYTEPRNELVKASFVSPTGLQARMWKVALKDAFESVDRNWLALARQLRPQVAWMRDHQQFNKIQAHYAFWVLKKSQRMAALVSGKEQLPMRFKVPGAKKVRSFLKRKIRQQRGRSPRVRSRRSFALDPDSIVKSPPTPAPWVSVDILEGSSPSAEFPITSTDRAAFILSPAPAWSPWVIATN